MIDRKLLVNLDWILLLTVVLLSVIGVLLVASASQNLSANYAQRQAAWTGIGIVLMLIAMSIDYHRLTDRAAVLYLPVMGLLVYLLIFGRTISGAKSWIVVGPIRIQPSELAKIVLALMLAKIFAEFRMTTASTREVLVVGLIAGVPFLLTAAQPDLGTAATLVPIAGCALMLAGLRARWFVAMGLLVVVVCLVAWIFLLKDYQRARVVSFISPGTDPRGSGYHSIQSRIAVGSGGVYGRGYRKGSQSSLEFLPARHTDFVFSVLAEEEGFLGTTGVLVLYAVLILRGLRAARHARDREGLYLAACLTTLIAFHIIINVGMVAGLLPITGIPLPFLSYGGSFTVTMFISIGLILNVRMRRTVN
ncbi:MAG: rod shape-determining protein RodA [Acidobacteriota bacterium]